MKVIEGLNPIAARALADDLESDDPVANRTARIAAARFFRNFAAEKDRPTRVKARHDFRVVR